MHLGAHLPSFLNHTPGRYIMYYTYLFHVGPTREVAGRPHMQLYTLKSASAAAGTGGSALEAAKGVRGSSIKVLLPY